MPVEGKTRKAYVLSDRESFLRLDFHDNRSWCLKARSISAKELSVFPDGIKTETLVPRPSFFLLVEL